MKIGTAEGKGGKEWGRQVKKGVERKNDINVEMRDGAASKGSKVDGVVHGKSECRKHAF